MIKKDDMSLIVNSINSTLTNYVVLNKNDIIYDKLNSLSLEALGYYIKLKAIIVENEVIESWYMLPEYDLNSYDDLMKELIDKDIIEFKEQERKILFKC